jgi:hypothetical protein
MEDKNYTFNISLSVLNHLGRNLYRSFPTVIGEAISNAWDANAENVWIDIDRDHDRFWIKDDGLGMDAQDFKEKFLKVGHSKRTKGGTLSPTPYERPYIGNKGIGKLALLSCADKITIISRRSSADAYVGGAIDNTGLDKAIKDDISSHDYLLEPVDDSLFATVKTGHNNGTIICFESIKDGIRNTDDFLKKIIALHFRFSLVDPSFNIYLDGELVTLESLKKIAEKTEFVWNINQWSGDEYLEKYCGNVHKTIPVIMSDNITGFIASVEFPSNRNIHTTGEKVGVDLFVNGRVRETDILKHIPSAQLPENYLYGQIHFNDLDADGKDRFISSREGVLADDPLYKNFLKELKKTVLSIMDQWDDLRDERGKDGNLEKASKFKKAKSLYREIKKEYEGGVGDDGDDYLVELTDDAAFNSTSYIECFISENLLRRYIRNNGGLHECLNIDPQKQTCRVRKPEDYKSWCEYCQAERSKEGIEELKKCAKMEIQIRDSEEDMLMYLDYEDLARIIKNSILKEEDKPYKPLRNSVMHTARLTVQGKTRLTSVFDNVVATVKKLIG